MLRLNRVGSELRRLVASKENDSPSFFSIAFEHLLFRFERLPMITVPGETASSPGSCPHYNLIELKAKIIVPKDPMKPPSGSERPFPTQLIFRCLIIKRSTTANFQVGERGYCIQRSRRLPS